MRAFIAIRIPNDLASSIWETVRGGHGRLRPRVPEVDGVRWVRPDNLHFTLKFLGEISDDQVGRVAGAMDALPADVRPFHLELERVGGFPNLAKPKVLWVGVDPGSARDLSALALMVEEAMRDLGFDRERRPMRSHLTIARMKKPARARGLAPWADALEDHCFGGFEVNEVVLFQSILKRTGAEYTPLHVRRLDG